MESWEDKKEKLFNRDRLRCRRCQRQTSSLSLHHIIPRELHGSNEDENLITLCNKCHDWVELNLAFEPLLRTRTGIINSTPTVQHRVVQLMNQTGYALESDKVDIWSMWVKQGRKGAAALIEKYGAKVEQPKVLEYTPNLSTGSTHKKVKVSSTMTKEEYNKLLGLV